MLDLAGRAGALALTCFCLAIADGPGLGRADAAAPLPPELVALEQKMGALQITSLRFSFATKLTGLHLSRKERQLFGLLGLTDTTTSGEATINPAAANVETDLLSLRITLRGVGSSIFVRIPQLAPVDGGRPWVALGPGGLGELFTATENGHRVKAPPPKKEAPPSAPPLAQPPFAGLTKLIAGAREVRALGPATVDGQSVQRFVAVLEPGQLQALKAQESSARVRQRRKPKSVTTLEVALAQDGLPVSIVVVVRSRRITTTATLTIPAINFPLVIQAPPASETISVAELRALEKQAEERKRHRAHKRKRLPRRL